MEEVEKLGGMAAAIDAGIPKMRIEESAAKTQARIDSGTQTVVGVNKYLSDEKDTVGEISYALEKVWGRYEAKPAGIKGVYSSSFDPRNPTFKEAKSRINAFTELEGRKPKILIAKMGQDGHDRGQKVVASAFIDIGFDVVIGPLFQTPQEAAELGIETDVDVIAASSLAAGHLSLIPELREALKDADRNDIMIIVGGVIPPEDVQTLKDMGAKAVFPPGTNIPEAVLEVLDVVNMRLSQGA